MIFRALTRKNHETLSLSLFSPCLFFSPRRPLSLFLSLIARPKKLRPLAVCKERIVLLSFLYLFPGTANSRRTLISSRYLPAPVYLPPRELSRQSCLDKHERFVCIVLRQRQHVPWTRYFSLSLSLCIFFSAPLRAISYPLLPSRPSTAVRTHWSESFIFRSLTLLSFRKSMRSPPYSLSFSLSFLYSG